MRAPKTRARAEDAGARGIRSSLKKDDDPSLMTMLLFFLERSRACPQDVLGQYGSPDDGEHDDETDGHAHDNTGVCGALSWRGGCGTHGQNDLGCTLCVKCRFGVLRCRRICRSRYRDLVFGGIWWTVHAKCSAKYRCRDKACAKRARTMLRR